MNFRGEQSTMTWIPYTDLTAANENQPSLGERPMKHLTAVGVCRFDQCNKPWGNKIIINMNYS